MKVTLESTTKIVNLSGVDCRLWEGVTAAGVKCHAYIPRIAVHEDDDATEFEKELKEQRKPSAALDAIPLRMIL